MKHLERQKREREEMVDVEVHRQRERDRDIVIKDKWGQGDTGERLLQVICFY